MSSLRLAACLLVAAPLVACASSPRPPPAPPPAPVAATPAAPAPAPAPPAPPPAPAVDPCAAGPVHDALAALGAGHALADERVGGSPRATERAVALAPMFPAVQRAGYQVLAVTPVEVVPGDARELAAVVAPVTATIERDRMVQEPHLAVLECRAGAGWMLAAQPHYLGTDGLAQFLDARPTDLPGGARAATVTVFSYYPTNETNTTAYLLGAATPALPVASPRGAQVGVLGVLGTVGERVAVEGGQYRQLVPFDATGWYPLGDAQVYVRVTREIVPSERVGIEDDGVAARPLATLDAQGLHPIDDGAFATWLLVGAGELPAWCTGRADVRCGRFTVGAEALRDVAIPYTWAAGAWTVGERVASPPRAAGARWLHAGAWDGDRPPRDPSNRAPLTTIPVRAAPPRRP